MSGVVQKQVLFNRILQGVEYRLRESLEALPEAYRDVLTLHYIGGMKVMEIARSLSISPSTIARRLREARSQLREEMFAMMSETYEQHKLPVSFTFRIVEAVKRIKIHPTSTMKGLPWGLSLATGIIIAVMSLNPYVSWFSQIGTYARSVLPSETKVLKVGEIPVDIVKTSNMAILSNKMGKGKGGEPKQPDENAFFMAPQGEGGEWEKKADMPTPRAGLGTSVVDRIIYAIGGYDSLSTVEAYDPKTDTWINKADMPTQRAGLSTSIVDGIIYAIGGFNKNNLYLSTVEAYDPKTDTWINKADMPTQRQFFSTSVVDGIIYVIGGGNNSVFSTVEAYDPKTDTWINKANMPTPRQAFSTSVVNGIIYAIGGWNGAVISSTTEAYDPKTDTWIKKANMLTGRWFLSTSAVNGKIYAIGGSVTANNGGGAGVGIVEEYDPVKDIWTEKADIPTARLILSTSIVNGKIYAIGGSVVDNGVGSPTVEEYTPEGWPFAVSPQNKLPRTWGLIKQDK
jgi:N-acetylneuraminic acid mutarotase